MKFAAALPVPRQESPLSVKTSSPLRLSITLKSYCTSGLPRGRQRPTWVWRMRRRYRDRNVLLLDRFVFSPTVPTTTSGPRSTINFQPASVRPSFKGPRSKLDPGGTVIVRSERSKVECRLTLLVWQALVRIANKTVVVANANRQLASVWPVSKRNRGWGGANLARSSMSNNSAVVFILEFIPHFTNLPGKVTCGGSQIGGTLT
jgi:hypothetical protein